MPQARIRHEFTLRAAPQAVAEHLADPRNYVGLSPLVIEVRDIDHTAAATRYTAIERVPLPFGRHLDNAIDVTLGLDDTDPQSLIVGGDVVSPGWVRLRYRYDISPDAAGTHIIDSLELRAPLGLLRFAASRAHAVQFERARVLAARLEKP